MKKIIAIAILTIYSSCKNDQTTNMAKAESQKEITHLPYFNSTDFTPQWEKGTHKIPDFSFTNQNGKTITNKNYEGKIYIADFFFTTCPGICPKLEKNMSLLQDAYINDDEIMLLSHTVMPWIDTIEKLKAYEQTNNINSEKWNLVTGERDAIYEIARNGYFADEDFKKTQDESDFVHTENFILIDKEGYIRGVYNGTIEIDVKRLMRHIEILKKQI